MRYLSILVLFFTLNAHAGDTTKLYDPTANVQKDLIKILAKAKKEKKHVLLQIGGNWCVWCYRFNSFVLTDTSLKHLLENNYVLYHLNYSKENKNLDYLKKLDFPQRFGFPVLVVLDADGNRLHTQDSSLLEKGNGYDQEKVKGFFINWAPSALNEVYYKE
ncbi:MAG TPA: thioredoxin family protein [Flavisolibacter sp.]|jgi:thioredoxin-related protein|nr:thioredoxin family protein [Flavisolibacter sp.]